MSGCGFEHISCYFLTAVWKYVLTVMSYRYQCESLSKQKINRKVWIYAKSAKI